MTQIITLSQLVAKRYTLDPAKTVVLATGIFDILHSEHRKFLTAAKKAGDILVVGLETDARIRELKGPNRPINPLATRLNNLASLNIADYVFSLPNEFDTRPNRIRFIKKLKPHILAVSENSPYLKNKLQLMSLVGGTVKVVLPYNPHLSTTKILSETEGSRTLSEVEGLAQTKKS